MNVASLPFLAFAIVAALLHGVWRNTLWRALVLLVANVAFLLSFTQSPQALAPFAAFLLLGYVSIVSVRYVRTTASTALFVAGTILLFCWLKQYWFLSFVPFLPFVFLTLGLSYAFFRVLGMIIDARDEPSLARVCPLSFLNFALNFPTFVAGPIDRYQDFARPDLPVTGAVIGSALQRIALGFFKVLALSAMVQHWQTDATAALLAQTSTVDGWKQAILSFGLYPIFLYLNFSGYTDIVLGVGELLAKRYPENFNRPFSSHNFIEFWSRWHMSLSFWLRDYLYTPLLKRGMQAGLPRSVDPYLGVLCFFVTFFIIGIWHGSTVIFAIYGLLLGLGVSINKLYQVMLTKRLGKKGYKQLSEKSVYRMICRGLTYSWYCMCMIFFWNTGPVALKIFDRLHLSGVVIVFILLLVAVTILLNAFEAGLSATRARVSFATFGTYAPYVQAMCAGLLIFGCIASAVLTQQVNALIIYQAF